MTESSQVILVTDAANELGEPGHEVLDKALEARGVSSRWAVWDEPFMDWSTGSLVVPRSLGAFEKRLPDFLGWAAGIGRGLVNNLDVIRWNTDQAALIDIASVSKVPVVPTVTCNNPVDLRAAVSRFGASVVKPRHGAGGRGIVIVYDAETWLPVDAGPWVVQPLIDSVQHEGEVSVFVIGGQPVSQVRKIAGRDDIRSAPEYGGMIQPTQVTHEAAILAVDALAAATEFIGSEVVYARVDMLRREGSLLVSDLELIAPNFYFELLPENAERLADAILAKL